jgi:hypothetical protein
MFFTFYFILYFVDFEQNMMWILLMGLGFWVLEMGFGFGDVF